MTTCLRAVLILAAAASLPSWAQSTEAFPDVLERAETSTRLKQWDAAASQWSKVVEANPHVASFWNQLGIALVNKKDFRGAIKAYQKTMDLGLMPAVMAYLIASCHGALGDRQQALAWTERALALGHPRPQRILRDTNLQILREHPRFKALLGADDVSVMSRVDGWRYDLDYFLSELKRMHPNPHRRTTVEAFAMQVGLLRNDIPKLNDEQIAVGFMNLAALAGDGHTYLRPAFLTEKGKLSLPVAFYPFAEGVFVVAAPNKQKDLMGTQVMQVGGHPIDDVMSAISTVVSRDNAMGLLTDVGNVLRSPQLLFGLGLIPDPKQVVLTVRDARGQDRSVAIDGQRIPPEGVATVLEHTPASSLPISMQARSGAYWFEYLPQHLTVYFQFNQVRNDEREPLPQFCDRLFRFIEGNDVGKLVIDLRGNSGGDGSLNMHLIHLLIRAHKVNQAGRLFVLIGRETFSAALGLTSQLERQTKAILVGEPTGSNESAIGEMNPIILPYSKMSGSIASMGGGNRADARTWIAPQLYAPPTFAAYSKGRDPALEAILEYGKTR